MQVLVGTLDGTTQSFDLEPGCFVGCLKSALCCRTDVQVEDQILVYRGEPLSNDKFLSEYDIHSGSTLFMELRMLGGALEPTTKELASKYNCEKMICRKCYARLPPKATHCRKRKCGRSSQLRPKKKLK